METEEPLKERLKRYEQSAKALFEHNPHIVWWMDIEGTILSVNSKTEKITGYDKSELINQSFDQFIHSKDLDAAISGFLYAKKGKPQNFEASLLNKNGHRVELNITFVPVTVDYKIVGVYGIAKDITERKKYVAALQESHEFVSMILESITDGFYALDSEWRITYWNKEAERMTKVKREDCFGVVFWDIFPQMIETIMYSKLHKALYEQISLQFEYYVTSLNLWFQIQVYPTKNGLSLYFKDITCMKKAEQQVAYMTYYDSITGLPNQKFFKERLTHILTRDKTVRHPLSVIVIDIDGFIMINDFLGYGQSERILLAISKRLASCVREEDFVCRHEGDVFAVLLQRVNRSVAERIAENILHKFQKPFVFDHQELIVTTSIGITICPEDGTQSDQLLANADMAMRRAKEKGKNRYEFYNEAMNARETLSMLKDLQNAYRQNELTVVYQPQVNIRSGSITGVETLLRWHHPRIGYIPPDEFITLAEESGMIVPIGEWVLKQACTQAVKWQEDGFEGLKVSVNLSPRQLTQKNIVETISCVLIQTGLQPQFLELEITEGMTVDIEHVLETLQDLKSLGVRISMDDFGKGYSSLNYLKRLPLDTLKIDRSFIADCTKGENDAAIVKTTISMAHHLDLNVVAEGVETSEQLLFLQRNLCDEIQGYLISKPLSTDELNIRFAEIQEQVKQFEVGTELSDQLWIEEQLLLARQELEDTVRKHRASFSSLKK